MITADHRTLDDDQELRLTVIIQDKTTQWVQCYPCKTKSAPEALRSLQNFTAPDASPSSICSNYYVEFIKACESLNWNLEMSTPPGLETNGIAERAIWFSPVCKKSGGPKVLLLSETFKTKLADGQTLHERRFDAPFDGPTTPFDAE